MMWIRRPFRTIQIGIINFGYVSPNYHKLLGLITVLLLGLLFWVVFTGYVSSSIKEYLGGEH